MIYNYRKPLYGNEKPLYGNEEPPYENEKPPYMIVKHTFHPALFALPAPTSIWSLERVERLERVISLYSLSYTRVRANTFRIGKLTQL